MNKKIILAGLLALATMCGTIGVHHSTNAESETAAVTALLNEYRHNGYYTKHTDIHITDKAVEELMKNNGFHQTSQLERTTYYTPDALWMSRESGKGYSYYGSNGKDLTNATTNDPLVAPENAGIALKYGADTSTGKWHDEVGGMEGYYYTLKDIANTDANLWAENGGIYSSENASVIDLFKAFCAPCYLGFTKDTNNYIDLVKAEIQETTNGLELRLIAKCEDGKIEDNGTVFATATVTKRHAYTEEVVSEEHKKTAANCTNAATYYKSCICGENGTETFTSGSATGHNMKTTWSSNDTKHWHECQNTGCTHKTDEADHSWTYSGLDSTNHKAKYECECGKIKTQNELTLYWVETSNYWGTDSAYAYAWKDGGGKNANWPGVKMKYEGQNSYNQNVYSIKININSYHKVIFTNNNGQQTEDINIYSLTGTNNAWYFNGWKDGKMTAVACLY